MSEQPQNLNLFDFPEKAAQRRLYFKGLPHPIWTENKAKLIARYLYYFVLVTKHGSYIDGFAGPQKTGKPEMWAANLVLKIEPRRLRHFYLFEKKKSQYMVLKSLKDVQPYDPKREIRLFQGDFNNSVQKFLSSHPIKEREATFCLLDQRTFECKWSTIKALATYKKEGLKIELFYFLPQRWLNRAIRGLKDMRILSEWWGREDWNIICNLKPDERAEIFCQRFKEEFNYNSVIPWPIFEKKTAGRLMYHMIHATDHSEVAPILMHRAYCNAVREKETQEQLKFEFMALKEKMKAWA